MNLGKGVREVKCVKNLDVLNRLILQKSLWSHFVELCEYYQRVRSTVAILVKLTYTGIQNLLIFNEARSKALPPLSKPLDMPLTSLPKLRKDILHFLTTTSKQSRFIVDGCKQKSLSQDIHQSIVPNSLWALLIWLQRLPNSKKLLDHDFSSVAEKYPYVVWLMSQRKLISWASLPVQMNPNFINIQLHSSYSVLIPTHLYELLWKVLVYFTLVDCQQESAVISFDVARAKVIPWLP